MKQQFKIGDFIEPVRYDGSKMEISRLVRITDVGDYLIYTLENNTRYSSTGSIKLNKWEPKYLEVCLIWVKENSLFPIFGKYIGENKFLIENNSLSDTNAVWVIIETYSRYEPVTCSLINKIKNT